MPGQIIDKEFNENGKIYAIYLNNFVVFHTKYVSSCYRFVFSHFVKSDAKALKSYAQVSRDLMTKGEHIIVDAIGTEYKIQTKTLFK